MLSQPPRRVQRFRGCNVPKPEFSHTAAWTKNAGFLAYRFFLQCSWAKLKDSRFLHIRMPLFIGICSDPCLLRFGFHVLFAFCFGAGVRSDLTLGLRDWVTSPNLTTLRPRGPHDPTSQPCGLTTSRPQPQCLTSRPHDLTSRLQDLADSRPHSLAAS